MSEDDAVLFTREEENRMQTLEKQESLTEAESVELARIKQRYHAFLEEGEARLRAGAPKEVQQRRDGFLTSASKAAYFWGSLVATALPGYVGRQAGVTPDYHHWNFIDDHLILGALPVITAVGSSGNHLQQLASQLEEANKSLGLVVAALETSEMNGFGLGVMQFAQERDWKAQFGDTLHYIQLSIEDNYAAVPVEDAVNAVEAIQDTIVGARCVYIHCKAGKGRSWMIVMCYLTAIAGMGYVDALELIRRRRPQVNPSKDQQHFAFNFKRLYDDYRLTHPRAA